VESKITRGRMNFLRKHLFIPDCQVTPTTPTDHLPWIGEYIVDKKPDVIVNIGDFADMESLSSYDKGKKGAEGKRYALDIKASKDAMGILVGPLGKYNQKRRKNKEKIYKPEMHLTLGNHEDRIDRAIEVDPALDGWMSTDDLCYEDYGWTVHPFKEVVKIDGVSYSHFFYNPQSGKPYGGESAITRLKNVGFSFVQGHQQIYIPGVRTLNNGTRIRCLVCGACYLHDEDYRGPQANGEWRGIFLLNEVCNGDYVLNEVSLDFLCRRYEGEPLWRFMKKKYRDIFDNSLWLQTQEAERGNI
jgi:hypothetical protein